VYANIAMIPNNIQQKKLGKTLLKLDSLNIFMIIL